MSKTNKTTKMTREQIKKLSRQEKIDRVANLNESISINNGNHKTGRACSTMSFPPVLSCREDAPCVRLCYGRRGNQVFPNVLGAYCRNYRIWQEDPARFERQLDGYLNYSGLPLFRLFDNGDFPDAEFLEMTCRVFAKHPEVKVLAFTKRYEMVNEFIEKGGKVPSNMVIRFSAWDKNWAVPNPHNLPMAYVDFSNSDLNPEIPKNAYHCKGGKEGVTCSICRACFNPKVRSVKFGQH